ncbi:MAG TPA: rhomboid family intramembrane serine protease [Terriglobia bacterium]|nr:rhomboid family intramembrane serine protease [Terriglobia bacterium]
MGDTPLPLPSNPQYYSVAPHRYWPVATIVLLILNFIFFGLEILAKGVNNTQILLDFGASFGPYLRRGEYWRLVMPMFLHGGWLHILGNSYALFILGPIMERVYGYGRYLTIYVAAGMGGAFLSMQLSKNVSVGASGAIFGLAGAMLVTGYVHRDLIPPRWGRAFGAGMIPFIVLNLVFGLSVHGVDNWGHLGGLATGALLAFVIPPPPHDSPYGGEAARPSQAMVVIPLMVVTLAIAATANHYRIMQTMNRQLVAGARFAHAGQYDRALQSYQQAHSAAPRQWEPCEVLGVFYLGQKKYDDAIQELQEAIRLSAGEDELLKERGVQLHLQLGIAYQLKGDLRMAQKTFEEVLGKTSPTPQGRRLLAENQLLLADLYASEKLYGEAINTYLQALRLAPDFAQAQNNLAWLYATCDDPKLRDPQAALDHALIAVKLTQGKDGGVIDTLAEAFFANGAYPQAVETQKKALALDPANTELKEHMERYRKAAGM